MSAITSDQIVGIVLAGGQPGDTALERLLPRPFLPVADSPLVCYALRSLRDAGIRQIAICTNRDAALLRRLLGDGHALGLDLTYFEDDTPRGPAGSIRDATLSRTSQYYVVIEATVLPTMALQEVVAAHINRGAMLTVAVTPQEDEFRPGNPVRRPAGISVLSAEAARAIAPTGYQDLKETLIPALLRRGAHVAVHTAAAASPRVTDATSYVVANWWAIRALCAEEPALHGYVRRDEALVHETADVACSALLLGPNIIGPQTRVLPEAVVVGPTITGANCIIGPSAVVSGSVLWDDCHLQQNARVDHTVLTTGVLIRAGETCTNVVRLAQPSSWMRLLGAGAAPRRTVPHHALRRPAAPWKPLQEKPLTANLQAG